MQLVDGSGPIRGGINSRRERDAIRSRRDIDSSGGGFPSVSSWRIRKNIVEEEEIKKNKCDW